MACVERGKCPWRTQIGLVLPRFQRSERRTSLVEGKWGRRKEKNSTQIVRALGRGRGNFAIYRSGVSRRKQGVVTLLSKYAGGREKGRGRIIVLLSLFERRGKGGRKKKKRERGLTCGRFKKTT